MFREGRRERPNAGKDVSCSYPRAPGSMWACPALQQTGRWVCPSALLEGTLAWLKENGLCCYPDLCLKPGSTTDHITCVTTGKCPFLQL